MNLEVIKNEIIKDIKSSEVKNWKHAKIVFDFPPLINRNTKLEQIVTDDNGNLLSLIQPSIELRSLIHKFIISMNQDGYLNQIVFEALNADLDNASIEAIFNEEVDTKFRKNIPKNYKGSTLPWWKNPEETKGLI